MLRLGAVHHRSALLWALLFAAALLAPTNAKAGGALLAPAGTQTPAMDVRMAVAIGPGSTTRWSEVTLPPGPSLGWLVPVRPGATIEWAPTAWLASLETASTPRVRKPEIAAPCSLAQTFETPAPWVKAAPPAAQSPIALPATAADAEAWATGHGLSVSAAEMKRLTDLYASGWRAAAIELPASSGARSSPTLRVTDDGGAILPLSIGVSGFDTSVTLFVVGEGNATLDGQREIVDSELRWGAQGSSYTDLRKDLLAHQGWLRESASHAALFDVVTVTTGGTSYRTIPPVAMTYLDIGGCAGEVQGLGSSTTVQPAEKLTCGTRDDLAIALGGIAPANAVLTRFVGVLPAGRSAGTPAIGLEAAAEISPVHTAGAYDRPCGVDVGPSGGDDDDSSPTSSSSSSGGRKPSSSGSSGSSGSSYSGGSSSYDGTSTVYVPSDGCGGGTTVVESGDDDDDDTWTTSDDSSDDCSGDTSSSSSSSDDGWDSSDSSDGCGSDSTSSSDGWDSSDSDCTAARHKRRRGPSPLSRIVIVAVALLIPLRRRFGGRA